MQIRTSIPSTAGLNLGLPPTGILAAGAPTISVTGFDRRAPLSPRAVPTSPATSPITSTGPSVVTHSSSAASSVTRTSTSSTSPALAAPSRFDGSRGPWGGAGTQLSDLSDFLIGAPTNSSGAKLLQGKAQRVWTLNTQDYWGQDDFQATRKLNLNYRPSLHGPWRHPGGGERYLPVRSRHYSRLSRRATIPNTMEASRLASASPTLSSTTTTLSCAVRTASSTTSRR